MLDEKGILRKLRGLKAKTVLVQMPEGLKARAAGISDHLSRNGIRSVISVEPCFGACDLRDKEAKDLGCDAVLHIGHSDFGLKTAVPVIFDEYRVEFDPVIPLKRGIRKLHPFRAIGLVTTVQHVGSLGKAVEYLRAQGHDVLTGKSKKLKDGQVLGCDFSSAESIASKVDCFLYMGTGRFHPLGLLERVDKPVFSLDIESGELHDMTGERDRLLVRKRMRIEKARGLNRFAVFISTKQGQMSRDSAFRIRESLSSIGKDAFIISADTLTPQKIMGMGIEVLVNTACPRIYDDQKSFGIVILNPDDIDSL
ncbi:MAG: diphthamide biosynthesis enzyme Dph2 [Candidatus Aenigmarchaeota archaeon]|nr:diphthamide biosynthesis enzyme Dph2 [Candidatus Aenigmarchaeota archaeon]